VKVWGEEYSKVIEIDCPLVSNQPCMDIQAQADNNCAAAAALFCVRQGYEVLSA
jgi:putative hemolysin